MKYAYYIYSFHIYYIYFLYPPLFLLIKILNSIFFIFTPLFLITYSNIIYSFVAKDVYLSI